MKEMLKLRLLRASNDVWVEKSAYAWDSMGKIGLVLDGSKRWEWRSKIYFVVFITCCKIPLEFLRSDTFWKDVALGF